MSGHHFCLIARCRVSCFMESIITTDERNNAKVGNGIKQTKLAFYKTCLLQNLPFTKQWINVSKYQLCYLLAKGLKVRLGCTFIWLYKSKKRASSSNYMVSQTNQET